MALIKKQIFRPSKDENLQQFLAKEHGENMEQRWGQPASKNKAKTRARAEGKIIGVAPKEGDATKSENRRNVWRKENKVKSEPKSPWDDESDALDQGSDNSNSADDRIKKARRIEARPKSTTNQFISEEEYEQDEESQSFKDWQAKNAEQEQSPVKKAVQDAWLEKKREASISPTSPNWGMSLGNKKDEQGNKYPKTRTEFRETALTPFGGKAKDNRRAQRQEIQQNKDRSESWFKKAGKEGSGDTVEDREHRSRMNIWWQGYPNGELSPEQWIKDRPKRDKAPPQVGDSTKEIEKARSRKDNTRTTEVTQEKLQRRAGLRAQVGKIDYDTMDKKQKADFQQNKDQRLRAAGKRDPGAMYSAPQQGMSRDNRLYRAQIGAAEDIANTKKAMQGEPIDMNYIQKAVWDAWFEKARSKKQQWAGLKRQTPSMPWVESPDPQGNPWDIRDRRKKLANPSMSSGEIQRIGAPASYTTTDGRTITQTPGPKYSKPEGHRTDWQITPEGKNVKIDAGTKKAMEGEFIDMNYIQKGVWEAWLEKASNGGDLTPEQKQALDRQRAALNRKRLEEDRRSDPPARREGTAKRGEKPTSADMGVQNVSETGGQVTPYKAPGRWPKDPARPIEKGRSKAQQARGLERSVWAAGDEPSQFSEAASDAQDYAATGERNPPGRSDQAHKKIDRQRAKPKVSADKGTPKERLAESKSGRGYIEELPW